MDHEKAREILQSTLKRETFTINPDKIFMTGFDDPDMATFQKQYLFHQGHMWRVERRDGSVVQCCEVTVAEFAELQLFANSQSALSPDKYAMLFC